MPYTLGEAAKAVGKTKAAIWQAIAAKRLRGEKDEKNRWQIDPEELFRLYPPLGAGAQKEDQKENAKHKESNSNLNNENSVLKERVKGLEELCKELREERDDWKKESENWREQTKRVLGVLAIEKQQQLDKWQHGTPTVIEVPPEPQNAPADIAPEEAATQEPQTSQMSFWQRVGEVFRPRQRGRA